MNVDSNKRRFAAIRVVGEDAVDFLQGQLSQDVSRTGEAPVDRGAWVNPSGRVIALFDMERTADGFVLWLPDSLVESVQQRLMRFVFRSKVAVDVPQSLSAYPQGEPDWPLRRLREGVPWIDAETTERYTAHQLNLDRIGAISFQKGCYSGQEIIARTENLGRVKRRVRRFVAPGEVSAGRTSSLRSGERKVGELVDAVDNEALILTSVDVPAGDLHLEDGNLVTPADLPFEIPVPARKT